MCLCGWESKAKRQLQQVAPNLQLVVAAFLLSLSHLYFETNNASILTNKPAKLLLCRSNYSYSSQVKPTRDKERAKFNYLISTCMNQLCLPFLWRIFSVFHFVSFLTFFFTFHYSHFSCSLNSINTNRFQQRLTKNVRQVEPVLEHALVEHAEFLLINYDWKVIWLITFQIELMNEKFYDTDDNNNNSFISLRTTTAAAETTTTSRQWKWDREKKLSRSQVTTRVYPQDQTSIFSTLFFSSRDNISNLRDSSKSIQTLAATTVCNFIRLHEHQRRQKLNWSRLINRMWAMRRSGKLFRVVLARVHEVFASML